MLGRLIISVTLLMTCLVAVSTAMAQASSLSATMNVHVFPSQGQDEIQQSMDEAECFNWAADRTGTDPFALSQQANEQMAAAEQAMAQAQSAGQGSTGRAAAGGAVTGALIGGVFGSSSKNSAWKGAAAGAATGAIIGNSRKRGAQAQATEQVAAESAQAQAATQAQMDGFKTAFTTCLEAKDYIARF